MNTIYDAKILIVDDNADLLALLCEQLRGAGYGKIRTAQSCGGARAAFAAGQPELMILDINLPDGDGFSLFRALRAKADVPALFLSARDADADRLFGLGLGADDYLTKPFLIQELLLRVQHILQRAYRAELSAAKPTVLQLGPRSVDLNDAVVSLPDGKTLALTATELALLRKLAENRGHIVTYDAICDAVWGADYYGYENSLGVHIRHLREKLNRTGAQLQAKNEMLARRDNARTQWIAGVSHDVRTPLALIMGWAEQLERDAETPAASRQKATGIRTQCEKLRTLIDDLNLTSKLEYGAQPLRRKSLRAGPLFRALVAQFCENAQEKKCEIALEQSEQSEQAMLCADRALLERLLENLLNNSIRHNPGPVSITVRTEAAGGYFCLTVADDGCGYPPAVLAAMNAPEPCENAPHILGLHVVEQIAIAHGGKAEFAQNIPQGAKAVISLPME